MTTSQQFAWDSENGCFYYINNVKMMYTKISKSEQKEVYNFLMNVYGINWSRVKYKLDKYTFVRTMEEISNY